MNRVSARELQLFVGGAVALSGFRMVLTVLHELFKGHPGILMAGWLSVLGLPLGIAILLNSPRAVRLAQIYLGFEWVGSLAILLLPVLHLAPPGLEDPTWLDVVGLITPLVLFAMLTWSQSWRVDQGANA